MINFCTLKHQLIIGLKVLWFLFLQFEGNIITSWFTAAVNNVILETEMFLNQSSL